MSTAEGMWGLDRIANDDVWQTTKHVFLAAALLFAVNIALGFVNTFTTGSIPRWQALTHLHAGTVGWIALSIIGFTIWLYTGDRNVSTTYIRRVRLFAWLTILAFTGLIASFAAAFATGGPAMDVALPVFAVWSAGMIWVAVIYAGSQLRYQPVVTTPHLLVAGGLLVAAVGTTAGALVGLENAIGGILPISHDMGVAGHQATTETALLLIGTGIVEWLLRREHAGGWTWPGAAQTAFGITAGLTIAPWIYVFAGTNLQDLVVGVFLAGAILVSLVFLARVGWRALYTNPFRRGAHAWSFYGTVGLLSFVILWLPTGSLDAGVVIILHLLFAAGLTNLLLAVLTVGTDSAHDRYVWSEPAAMYLFNGGLILFLVLEATMDSPHGAVVMGLGALLAIAIMAHRLHNGHTDLTFQPATSTTDTDANATTDTDDTDTAS